MKNNEKLSLKIMNWLNNQVDDMKKLITLVELNGRKKDLNKLSSRELFENFFEMGEIIKYNRNIKKEHSQYYNIAQNKEIIDQKTALFSLHYTIFNHINKKHEKEIYNLFKNLITQLQEDCSISKAQLVLEIHLSKLSEKNEKKIIINPAVDNCIRYCHDLLCLDEKNLRVCVDEYISYLNDIYNFSANTAEKKFVSSILEQEISNIVFVEQNPHNRQKKFY